MNIHFIAIGGAAMHNLALALAEKQYNITGSDDEIFEPSKSRLEKAGLLPAEPGWFPEKIHRNLDAVILGMHARADNPELIKAKELGIMIYSYPEFLYEQTKSKKRIVVAGSHGKTTVTSMIMHVLKSLKIDFDYMVGAQIDGFETMVSLKETTEIAVFEGDEYLTSPIDPRPKFHLYKPHIAVINGIAWDHINVFPTFDLYCMQFKIFANMIQPGGELIYYNDDNELNKIIAGLNRTDIKTTGFNSHAYKQTENSTSLLLPDGSSLLVNVFGKHNMQNICAAKAVCDALNISNSDFYNSISTFNGSSKRLQLLYNDNKTTVYLDFAHAPSKVSATVKAVRERFPGRFFLAFFELHTFSSLNKQFLKDYKNTLNEADFAIVYYDPDVIEHKKLEPIDKLDVEDAFCKPGLNVINNIKDLELACCSFDKTQPVVALYMSSGNIGGLSKEQLIKFVLA